MHPINVDGELTPVALVEVSKINYNIAAKDIAMYPNNAHGEVAPVAQVAGTLISL